MIAAGYEDGNDASNLRGDPMFKMALDLSPSDRELRSQSTIVWRTCPTLAPCYPSSAPRAVRMRRVRDATEYRKEACRGDETVKVLHKDG